MDTLKLVETLTQTDVPTKTGLYVLVTSWADGDVRAEAARSADEAHLRARADLAKYPGICQIRIFQILD